MPFLILISFTKVVWLWIFIQLKNMTQLYLARRPEVSKSLWLCINSTLLSPVFSRLYRSGIMCGPQLPRGVQGLFRLNCVAWVRNEATSRWCEPTCWSHESFINLLLHSPEGLMKLLLSVVMQHIMPKYEFQHELTCHWQFLLDCSWYFSQHIITSLSQI